MIFAVVEIDKTQCFGRFQRVFGNLRDQRDVFDRGKSTDQVVKLEDKTHMLTPINGQLVFVGSSQIMIARNY